MNLLDDNSQFKALSENQPQDSKNPLRVAKYLQKNSGSDIKSGIEKVIDEFTCAAELRILIQGKLFVSNEAIYFYSSCNDKFTEIGLFD